MTQIWHHSAPFHKEHGRKEETCTNFFFSSENTPLAMLTAQNKKPKPNQNKNLRCISPCKDVLKVCILNDTFLFFSFLEEPANFQSVSPGTLLWHVYRAITSLRCASSAGKGGSKQLQPQTAVSIRRMSQCMALSKAWCKRTQEVNRRVNFLCIALGLNSSLCCCGLQSQGRGKKRQSASSLPPSKSSSGTFSSWLPEWNSYQCK